MSTAKGTFGNCSSFEAAQRQFRSIVEQDRQTNDVTVTFLHIDRRESGRYTLDFEYEFTRLETPAGPTMRLSYLPTSPASPQSTYRAYEEVASTATVNVTAPHVGTDTVTGEPVEVYWWSAMHGWFQKDSVFLSCRCESCIAAAKEGR